MSDSEEDFLSADEGSDFEELPSSIKEKANDIPPSQQCPERHPTNDQGDSQTTQTSLSDISELSSLQAKEECSTKSVEGSQTKNTLILDVKESEINNEHNLQEVNTEPNLSKDSKLEKGLDEDFEVEKNKVDCFDVIHTIDEPVHTDESEKDSKSLAVLSKKIENINLKDDFYNTELSNALPLEENKSDRLETCLNKLEKPDIITDQKEINLNFAEKPSEGKEDLQLNQSVLSDIESNIKHELPKPNDSSIPKPIKTSKIGAKKNREKTGGKMGTKKLGSKVTKIIPESVSSENQITSKEEKHYLDNQMHEKHPDSTDEKNIMQEGRQEEEKRKQKEWDEQQSRWQEVQGIRKPLEKSSQSHESSESGWGGWGNWGSSLISAVGTLTTEVGRGVGTVIETVEGGLGVPDPETLAKELADREQQIKEERLKNSAQFKDSIENAEKKKIDLENVEQTYEEPQTHNDITGSSQKYLDKEQEIEKLGYLDSESQGNYSLTSMTGLGTNSFGGLGSLMSGASKALETASNKVLLGGLDTLELIGQRAMDTIQKGDPGLRKKRALLVIEDSPNLSHTLHEALQSAASKDEEQKLTNPQRPTLYQAWDNTEGPVHLEALYLVAKQCQGKTSKLIQTLPPHSLTRLNNSNADISTCCELSDDNLLEEGDFLSLVDTIMEGKGLPLQTDKIKKAWTELESTKSLITMAGEGVVPSIESQLYTALAAFLAQIVSVIHKGSELALITPDVAPQDVAHQFKRLASLVCGSVENVADNVCSFITAESSSADPQVNNIVTNIYLQASEGNNYLQQCLKHHSTVVQYSNTKQFISAL